MSTCNKKSCSNPFLEPTSTVQWGYCFLLKETTGAIDGFQTHTWQASTDYVSNALTTAPLIYQFALDLYFQAQIKETNASTKLRQTLMETLRPSDLTETPRCGIFTSTLPSLCFFTSTGCLSWESLHDTSNTQI